MKIDLSDVLITGGLGCTGVAVYLIADWVYLLLVVGVLLLIAGVLRLLHSRKVSE